VVHNHRDHHLVHRKNLEVIFCLVREEIPEIAVEPVLARVLRVAVVREVPVRRACRESLTVSAAPRDALAHELVPGVFELDVPTFF
jgi:hypothetical protein